MRNGLAPRSYPAGTQRGVFPPPLWIADQVRNDGLDGNDDMVLHKVSSEMMVWLAQKLSNKRLIFQIRAS